ncbi:MAG: type II toxin-antitoxin system VapC family toxin [Bacteroidota bacterium]|jgi:predicted nucleic acid-binding protein|nr:PIN domain-containing protein [Chitinophagaceae bacterium]MCE2759244.1 PIN domain-containing protein [Chitinophagaceae bacterium]
MRRVFLDTDVLIDFLSDRQPYSQDAAALLSWAIQHEWEILVSAISFDNIYYVMRRNGVGQASVIKALKKIYDTTTCVAVDAAIISAALESDFKDFEDGIQCFAALQAGGVSFFVTRNLKDYKKAAIQVVSPQQFMTLTGTF